MLVVIDDTEKKKVVNNIKSFYDLSTCSQLYGKEVIVGLSNKLGKIIYSDLRYTTFDEKDFVLYLKKEKILIGIMLQLLRRFPEIYVFNYGYKWMRDKRVSPLLNQILKKNKVCDDENAILKITEEPEVVALVKSIFRYNTFASFFVPMNQVVITPTDHLDIFISSKEDFSQEDIDTIKQNVGSKMIHLTKKSIN